MQEEEDFFINHKGLQLRVTAVVNRGNIYFVVHLQTPVTIAEGLVGETWVWYEVGKGETSLSTELGQLIELVDI